MSRKLYDLVRRMDGGSASQRASARQELTDMGPLAVWHLIAELHRVPRV